MRKDSKFVGNEQGVYVQMQARRQIRKFGNCWAQACGKFEWLTENGMSPVEACDRTEYEIDSDEEKFLTHARRSETPRTTVEAIRLMFKDRLSEKQIVKEAKRDDKFRRTLKKNMGKWNSLLAISKGLQMTDRLVKKQPSMDQEEAPEGIETASDRAFHYAMHYFMKTKPSRITRSAYRREPGRVSSRSRCTSRTAVASASSPGGDDSGGSEPPQSDPDLPSFRFVRSGTLRSYLKTDGFLSSWRLGRPGLMAHVRRWAA